MSGLASAQSGSVLKQAGLSSLAVNLCDWSVVHTETASDQRCYRGALTAKPNRKF